jgi:uncharacterized protein (DUF433 family)
MNEFDRITQDPEVMGGRPCVRGMRVTVGMIAGQVASGRTPEDIRSDFRYLEREDITQALRYAAGHSQTTGTHRNRKSSRPRMNFS